MVSNWKNPFDFYGLYTNILALQGLMGVSWGLTTGRYYLWTSVFISDPRNRVVNNEDQTTEH